ncbi:11873_t:CDS:2, partial [Cetraspora pellucida]
LHEYPIKPEIEYKNPTTGTYHYIILSEGHYPPSPILAKSQKKNNNCYRIPDKYKAKVSWGKKSKRREIICSIDYKNQDNDKEDNPTNKKPCFKIEFNNGLQVVESWKIFGLQLKCVEHNRDLYHQARVFKPIETYSNPTKRARLEQISKKAQIYLNNEISQSFHYNDKIQLESLTLAVNNQNWILDFEPKDDILKQKKRQSYVRVMDQNHISCNTIRSLAKINSEIEREYKISEEKININKIMQGFIPLSIIDINADISNTTEINNEIHIDDPNIVQ